MESPRRSGPNLGHCLAKLVKRDGGEDGDGGDDDDGDGFDGGGEDGGGTGGDDGTPGETDGPDGSFGTSEGQLPEDGKASGCSSTGQSQAPGWLAVFGLAGLGLVRRRQSGQR